MPTALIRAAPASSTFFLRRNNCPAWRPCWAGKTRGARRHAGAEDVGALDQARHLQARAAAGQRPRAAVVVMRDGLQPQGIFNAKRF
jgi:hypothetical protein